MADLLAGSLARRRFFTWLLVGFGALALVLGSVGIYGVTLHLVGGMMRDAGVRLALGATPGAVQRHVMWRSLGPALAGLAVGLAGAVAAGRLIRGFVFGIDVVRAPIYLTAVVVLCAVAAFATWLPARRAASLDPLTVVRGE